ncbi:alpha/beta hydrolase [Spongiactinospora sp. TRM90649]|uniref:alpha/beta fold hydrolase n=1 Tax=Spongiactinospora sp. TRM90649 TaxID=3031114 RepID=UPI0023F6DFE9|nr:alpha/beta hydrolase [Spongiactinospora sp. TRM90649]MDF5755295.1 alpha/beta hydrolase [Spongiactinospora sp. TRM90649]
MSISHMEAGMTEYLKIEGGELAYEVTGEGPLIVLAHGIGDSRRTYRFLAPKLAAAGFRVAAMDVRGHGESSIGWPAYTRTDAASDILALIRHLGGPAVVVGHSFSGGAATIAAARSPELVSAIVGIGPVTREMKIDLKGMRIARYRKGVTRLLGTALLRSVGLWRRYLDVAYPGARPADHAEYLAAMIADLRRPGRMAAFTKMGTASPSDAGALLGDVRSPALVVMGTEDPDWADPKAEAEGIVASMPAGVGSVVMIEGTGHYPHGQRPDEVEAAILSFLKER